MKRLLFVKPCDKCGIGYSTERKRCDHCGDKLPVKLWFDNFNEFDDYLEKHLMVEQAN